MERQVSRGRRRVRSSEKKIQYAEANQEHGTKSCK